MLDSNDRGRRIEFICCLGAGGFGEVYLANLVTSSGLQRRVAVKTLHAEIALRADAVMRLRDEARLLAALHHRAILQVLDLVDIGGRLGLITEYVEGQDLAEIIDARESLPVRVALEVVGELAGALDAALTMTSPVTGQPLNLVHRDLKPSNIRLTTTGGVKLLDFGIARSEAVEREAKTSTGLVVGSLGYLAPERFTEDEIGAESDIFALGCVLFEELSGRRLYTGVSKRTLARQALDREAHDAFIEEHLASMPERVPERVRALLRRTLAHEPSDRPTADQLERACDELAGKVDGPHMRRWARDRLWPPVSTRPGSLDGETISVSGLVSGVSVDTRPPSDELSSGGGRRPTLDPADVAATSGGRTMDYLTDADSSVGVSAVQRSLVPNDPATGDQVVRPRRGRGRALVVAGVLGLVLLVGVGAAVMSSLSTNGAETVATVPPSVEASGPGSEGPPAFAGRGPGRRGGFDAGDVQAGGVGTDADPGEQHVGAAGDDTTDGAAGGDGVAPDQDERGGDTRVAAQATVTPTATASPTTVSNDQPAGSTAQTARQAAGASDRQTVASPARSTPPAAALATGSVTVSSKVPFELRGQAGAYQGGEVPVGRYQVYADFGDGMKAHTTVKVTEGGSHTVRCSSMLLTCEVR